MIVGHSEKRCHQTDEESSARLEVAFSQRWARVWGPLLTLTDSRGADGGGNAI